LKDCQHKLLSIFNYSDEEPLDAKSQFAGLSFYLDRIGSRNDMLDRSTIKTKNYDKEVLRGHGDELRRNTSRAGQRIPGMCRKAGQGFLRTQLCGGEGSREGLSDASRGHTRDVDHLFRKNC
jgi:hypothetical protein